jgi:hypothetical protein
LNGRFEEAEMRRRRSERVVFPLALIAALSTACGNSPPLDGPGIASTPIAMQVVPSTTQPPSPDPPSFIEGIGSPDIRPVDQACEVDGDCLVTCSFGHGSCCTLYCQPCTTALRKDAVARAEANCRGKGNLDLCGRPGACPDPDEMAVARCVDGKCTAKLIPRPKPDPRTGKISRQ